MKKLLRFLLTASFIFLCLTPGISKAVIIDFEDLPHTNTQVNLPNNYMGFFWYTFDYFHEDIYNGVHSGLFAIKNNAANTYIDFGSEVDVNGAYFTKYPPHIYSVTIKGYYNDQMLYELVLQPEDLNTDPKYIQLDFNGITKITFYSPDAQFFMDDLYINELPPTVDAIIDFINDHADIVGAGPGNSANNKYNAFMNMLLTAADLIQAGDNNGACGLLNSIIKKCDGLPTPPDFITGDPETMEGLMALIAQLMESLGCPIESPEQYTAVITYYTDEEGQHFIEVELKDEEGTPVANEKYVLYLPDGSVKKGRLDENGEANIESTEPGEATIDFPQLHRNSWQRL